MFCLRIGIFGRAVVEVCILMDWKHSKRRYYCTISEPICLLNQNELFKAQTLELNTNEL